MDIVEIAGRRMLMGEAWVRMAVILSAVYLFTSFSGLILNSGKVKEKYPPKKQIDS